MKECVKQLKKKRVISPFPLGRYDIASIFTLPNNGCFGRAREIDLINSIIRRTAYMCGSNVKRRATTALSPPLKVENRKNRSPQSSRKRPTEIIAINGNTGVGKSALVRNVQEFARDYGYIAVTKFDKRQPTPYGCLLRSLSILLKSILGEPSFETERFSNMLKEQLGAETLAQLPTLLVDNVPELATFLDSATTLTKVDSTTSNNSANNSGGCETDLEGGEIKVRFHSAFIEIFQVIVNFKFVTLVSL